MTDAILAIDQGTSSSRAILFGRGGQLLAAHQQDFPQYYPRNGWVEHDALDIWQSQKSCVDTILREADQRGHNVKTIGITNQRETTVIWDRQTGEPIAPAIVWQDRRTADQCQSLIDDGHSDLFGARTGLRLDPYFSGTKIRWLLEHTDGAQARAERGELAFGTIDSWLIWQLSGGAAHVTDVSNASRTLVFNIHTLDWDHELLDILGIPPALMPKIVPSSGHITDSDPGITGKAYSISGIAGDQQAATFGQACFTPGMAKNTYGTGCFMLMNTGTQPIRSQHDLLVTVGWQLSDPKHSTQYMLEGSVFMGGATIQWLRDGLGIIDTAPEIEALAASVPDCGDVYFVPAMTGLGAPYWDASARGTITGLTRGSHRAHIARAALEGIALQSYDLLTTMNQDASVAIDQLRVDGGASANNLLMQIQADILGTPVVRPIVTETTALGAAYLAGLAEGIWASTDDIAELWTTDRIFEPQQNDEWRTEKIGQWQRAIERSQGWYKAL